MKDRFRIDKNALNFLLEKHYTGYTQDTYQPDSEINSTSELWPSRILPVNDVLSSKRELILISIQKLVDKFNLQASRQVPLSNNNNASVDTMHSHIICIPHSSKPFNEYKDPTLFFAGFPVLYLYSVGGYEGSALSLFITINPADLYSPIIMMYARSEIDFEKLTPENFLKLIINTLIGYNKVNDGIFSTIKNYYDFVEYQDQGILHCYMLVWLYGALDPIMLHHKIKEDEKFHQCLLHYISDIIKEDLSYLLIKGEDAPSFKPIPNLRSTDFVEKFCQDLLAITKHMLFHNYNQTCKKYNHSLQKHCKFDFLHELVDSPGMVFSNESIIAVQCVNAFINNYNPYITIFAEETMILNLSQLEN
ncbi:8886_t:CDS:2 [Cetraspora pellucida]|uniref:8886_t:CDS:1 n=1 Tax=Cetraspora pellucida TaxID=1433469 RepID=A0A9N9BUF6_9GLOM|nr:8886_t:CDS:2 [Cetraspora pellucida]